MTASVFSFFDSGIPLITTLLLDSCCSIFLTLFSKRQASCAFCAIDSFISLFSLEFSLRSSLISSYLAEMNFCEDSIDSILTDIDLISFHIISNVAMINRPNESVWHIQYIGLITVLNVQIRASQRSN